VVAVLVSGSTGRGQEDEWSDLDLIVVSSEETATVLATPVEAERFGDLVAWVDCSFNAPLGATQAFARYLTPEGLVLVDWNAWPLAAARLTAGSRVLWSRPEITIDTFDGTFYDLVVSRPRRQIAPYSRQQRAEWELCMCHLAVSLPARGRDARPALLTIGSTVDPGPEPVDQLAAIADHIESLRSWLPPRTFRASLERVEAARTSVRRQAAPGPSAASPVRATRDNTALDTPDWYCTGVLSGTAGVEVVFQTATALALRPDTPGFGDEHIIVIPKHHVRSLLEAEPRDLLDSLALAQQIARDVTDRVGGCQVLTAIGSEQHNRHLHWHIAAGAGVARFVSDPGGGGR